MTRRKKGNPVHGWLVLDKPVGMTSTQAVGAVRRAFNAQKAGHAGTLDPLATGILPIALGEATKTVPFVMDGRKSYRFTVRWGIETDTDDGVRRYFEYAKAAGMPVMVSTCKREVLPRVEKYAKQYDIKVAIHNHGPEDKNFPSPYDVLAAVKSMDSRMGLCMDIGHTVRTGTDVVRAAADAGPRLLDMHAKDLRDLSAKGSQCIVGEGKIPIPALFQQLATMRYGGYVNLEYEINAKDPLPGMHRSFSYMRGVLAGLASA